METKSCHWPTIIARFALKRYNNVNKVDVLPFSAFISSVPDFSSLQSTLSLIPLHTLSDTGKMEIILLGKIWIVLFVPFLYSLGFSV